MYWTDQPQQFLKSGDYGYNRSEFPFWDPNDKTPGNVGSQL